jgi:DnaJ-domain-containing protein 1
MAPEFIRLAEERTQKINAAYANLKRQNRDQ